MLIFFIMAAFVDEETAALDAAIALRNQADSHRRSSIQMISALADSDYDSDEEEVDEVKS